MAKYFLNIRQSGRSDDKEGNIIYDFELETPLFFLWSLEDKKYEYKYLEIKTSKNENDFFCNTDNEGGIGGKFSPITIYWNLCVPDDMKGFSMTGISDKLTLDDEEGKIYLEPFHFELSTLKIKPVEIVWKGTENFRVKIETYSIRDETQKFNLEFNEIELESKKYDKFRSTIENSIEKGQTLTLKLNLPNKTYFRKTYLNNQAINTLVIPQSSLQETSTAQNSSNSDKYFYFLMIGSIVLILLLFLSWFFLIKRPKSPKK